MDAKKSTSAGGRAAARRSLQDAKTAPPWRGVGFWNFPSATRPTEARAVGGLASERSLRRRKATNATRSSRHPTQRSAFRAAESGASIAPLKQDALSCQKDALRHLQGEKDRDVLLNQTEAAQTDTRAESRACFAQISSLQAALENPQRCRRPTETAKTFRPPEPKTAPRRTRRRSLCRKRGGKDWAAKGEGEKKRGRHKVG